MIDLFQAAGLEPEAPRPLADRLRPQTLGEVVGQDHLLGDDSRRAAAMRAIGPSSPSRWSCPTTSPRVWGRSRSARGRGASGASPAASKRSLIRAG